MTEPDCFAGHTGTLPMPAGATLLRAMHYASEYLVSQDHQIHTLGQNPAWRVLITKFTY